MKLQIKNTTDMIDITPSKVIALGLNYRSHITEHDKLDIKGFTDEIPAEPVLFPKLPSSLTESEMPIVLPAILDEYAFSEERTDYEGELAFIILKKCKNIKPEQAYDYILGYTIINDVSQRNLQNGDRSGWFRGKSFDTFAPLGPVLVLKNDIPDPHNLRLTTRVNGKVVQDANTSQMIFTIPKIISFVSRNFTLMPGDIIATGTPGGVGELHENDLVEIEIEKIGVLRNKVIKETRE